MFVTVTAIVNFQNISTIALASFTRFSQVAANCSGVHGVIYYAKAPPFCL